MAGDVLQVGDCLEFKLLKRNRKAIIAEDADPQEAGKKLNNSSRSGASASASRQSSSSRAQKAWRSVAGTSDKGKSSAEDSVLERLQYSPFSKFTQIEDAPLLWREAAEALAGYASEVSF